MTLPFPEHHSPDCWELDPIGDRLEQPETKAEERLFMVHMEVGGEASVWPRRLWC